MSNQLLSVTEGLLQAQDHAETLFKAIEDRNLIRSGLFETEINQAIYDLAFELFGISKYWHKRIVRAGTNTLYPYRYNPSDLMVQEDDVVFLDFGPIFESWEADFGRTYVLGNDPVKLKLKQDTEDLFQLGKAYFKKHQAEITGSQLFNHMCELAKEAGWEFGGPIAGHTIGRFPHEKNQGDKIVDYIQPDNHFPLSMPDALGQPRHWILEIHLIDREKQIGAFVEELLTID
jgi:Xaa-Pro aminopeptidase